MTFANHEIGEVLAATRQIRHSSAIYRRLAVLSLIAACGAALPSWGAGTVTPHPHGDIVGVVEAAALSAAANEGLDGIEVRVRPLDTRLRPALCDKPLEISRSHAGRVLGAVSYGVRCPSPSPWTLYLRADVSATLELPVLRAPMPRGSIIAENDLEVVLRRIDTPVVDVIVDPKLAIGMELKRPLPAGATVRHGQVAYPRIVERGQTVTLVAGTGGLEVRMQGKAMANGSEGDRLLVTNLSSGRRVEGIILANGDVRIP